MRKRITSFEADDANRLIDIGFTKNQARVYLTLLKLGKTEGGILSNNASMPTPVVYRTLKELQKMGLVEKEITFPSKFKATPLKRGLQILVNQSLEHYKKRRAKTEEILLRNPHMEDENLKEKEYRLISIEGKDRIIQTIKLQHEKACKFVDVLSTMNRWLHIFDCCFEDYTNNLARKVHYRILISKVESKAVFPDEVKMLLSDPNFELKVTNTTLVNNFGIFDGEEATFNFFPSKPLKESPIIWTNHPSFIAMAQDHFNKLWKSTRKYTLKNMQNF